jgi:hypothetical protein
VAFRIQDLMMDVRPAGYRMANPECTCQITVKQPGVQRPDDPPGRGPGGKPDKDPGRPGDVPPCKGTVVPSRDCPPTRGALAADLEALRSQLRQLSA